MNERERLEHNKLFAEASAIARDEIVAQDGPPLPQPGWLLRRRLKRALSLLERALALAPDNGSAMWLVGKVHQRLGHAATALSWFERAHQANPTDADVAREASLCAMDIGHAQAAMAYAQRASQIEPESAGLHANLALAYLLAGRMPEAQRSIERSLALDGSDTISQTLHSIIGHFATIGRAPPRTTLELQKYWRKVSAA